MSLSYFNVKKLRRQSKQQDATESATSPPAPAVSTPSEEPAASPMLEDEDQKFLERLAALAEEPEGTPPPLPSRPAEIIEDGQKKAGKDAQEAIMDGADAVPLPTSPPEVTVEDADKDKGQGKDKDKDGDLGRRKSVMSYFSLAQARFKKATEKDKDKEPKEKKGKEKESKEKKKDKVTEKDKKKLADDLHSAAEAAKSAEQKELAKEEQDITEILDQLNLSAVNNRVFSFSKESEELFSKFKLVLKDIINGAPTAYNDLEQLFTDYEKTLKKMYGNLPPFLQNLVKSLPTKVTAALGPELMAAQAEKPGFDAKQKGTASGAKSAFKKANIPSLKSLVSAEGAVATMLRSILNFLKLRFPAVMTGTNVVMSLAVCCKSSLTNICISESTNMTQYFSSYSGTAISAAAKRVSRMSVSQLTKQIPQWPTAHRPSPTMTQSSATNPSRRARAAKPMTRRSRSRRSSSQMAKKASQKSPVQQLKTCLA